MSPTMSPRLASCFCDVNAGSFVGGIPRKKIREKPQDADSSTTNEGFFCLGFPLLQMVHNPGGDDCILGGGGGSFKVYSPT